MVGQFFEESGNTFRTAVSVKKSNNTKSKTWVSVKPASTVLSSPPCKYCAAHLSGWRMTSPRLLLPSNSLKETMAGVVSRMFPCICLWTWTWKSAYASYLWNFAWASHFSFSSTSRVWRCAPGWPACCCVGWVECGPCSPGSRFAAPSAGPPTLLQRTVEMERKKPRGGLGVVTRGVVKLGEGGVGEGVKRGKRGQRVWRV